MMRATRPDVIALQESHDVEPLAVATFLNRHLPPANWQAAKRGVDLIVAARGAVNAQLIHSFEQYGSIAAFTVSVGPTPSRLLHIVNAHLPCGQPAGVEERRAHQLRLGAQHIAAWRARAPDTPILLVGDLNLVGLV
jgi:endonuclease/exonuclease/phosphatase family metal-dependent hydrolase